MTKGELRAVRKAATAAGYAWPSHGVQGMEERNRRAKARYEAKANRRNQAA